MTSEWNSPVNFNESLIENTHYLGRNYRQIAGLKYRILSDNIGYIYYETFADGIGNSDLDVVFSYLADCKALIFDVRQNSGGNATNSTQIASRFTNEKILTGYIQHKTGPDITIFKTLCHLSGTIQKHPLGKESSRAYQPAFI